MPRHPEGPLTTHDDHLETDPTDAPPAPPRALTPLVRRRAWSERRVRPWWVVAAVMLVIASYYAVSRYYAWSIERRLITTGQRVDAEVMGWDPGVDALPNRLVQADAQIDIKYTHAGQTYRTHGALAGRKEAILTRTKIPVIVDPANPSRWTARLEPSALPHELLPAMLLAPFVVVPLLVAVVNRRRVLRIYRDGEAVLARVVRTGHSAAAPGSRLIRCALHTGGDGRVIKTALPTRKTPLAGENLWLIAPPNRPQQAVPAALFE